MVAEGPSSVFLSTALIPRQEVSGLGEVDDIPFSCTEVVMAVVRRVRLILTTVVSRDIPASLSVCHHSLKDDLL